jgi:hypothetical protein
MPIKLRRMTTPKVLDGNFIMKDMTDDKEPIPTSFYREGSIWKHGGCVNIDFP